MSDTDFCSLIAKESAPSIVGTAGYKPCQVFLELEEPWSANLMASPGFPDGVDILLKQLMRQYKIPITLNAMCRDSLPNKDALQLFVLYCKPQTELVYTFVSFTVSYQQVTSFLEQVLRDLFEERLDLEDHKLRTQRAIMVCCHGARDRCCGQFGQELYTHLTKFTQQQNLKTQVWRTSHIGGHKFAPTLMDLPSMRVWGHLSLDEAESLLLKTSFSSKLLRRYRGFCGLPKKFEQFAESEAFKKFGWEWLNRADYQVGSNWQSSSGVEKGEVYFYQQKPEDAFFNCSVMQSGVYESQASCFKPTKKSVPIFAKI